MKATGSHQPKPLIVIIRGPMGAGKTTLMRGLARRSHYRFWALDADAVTDGHPSDPHGEHLDTEWPLEIEILALHARIILGRGLNMVVDSGDLPTAKEVDRFLGLIGRSRREPSVVLFRLMVATEEAVRRKITVSPAYLRAAHRGWRTQPIPGEIVIETSGLNQNEVLRVARRELESGISTHLLATRVRTRRTPRRRADRPPS